MSREFGKEVSGNRRALDELSKEQRMAILATVAAGKSKTEVARQFGVSRPTVYNTIERFEHDHTTASRPRKGGLKVLTPGDERLLLRIVRREPKITYNALISESQLDVSRRTVQRMMERYHIKNWLAAKRPLLTPAVAKKRLAFVTRMAQFDWKKVYFSDECSFVPGSGRQRSWVFRQPHQKWYKEMIDEIPKSGRPKSHMIWGAISYEGRSELIFMNRCGVRGGYNSESYVETLREGLVPLYEPGLAFQQDNAPIHKSAMSTE